MKIAIFSDTYPPQINGVATSTYNLVNILRKHGHDVLLVTINTDDNKFEYEDNTIKIPGVELKKFYGYKGTWIYNGKAFKIIKDFYPDIIHNQCDAPIGQFARIVATLLNIPFVYTYHTTYEDYTYIVTHGYFDRIAKKTIRAYSVYMSNFSTEFIAPSIKTKEMLRSYGSDNYINIIPTGIDFSLFDEKNIDKDEINNLKSKYNIDKDTFTFLLLGRLAKEKFMETSIEGFAHFVNKYPNIKCKLLIVGKGPNLNNLKSLVSQFNLTKYVIFVGPVEAKKVPLYYHLADIYTSASLTETQGLTFMEAMASSCLVLARYDDNLAGTIEDQETGFFFTDNESFVNKAHQIYLMTDEEKQTIRNNALKIIEQYSIETFYNNIMEVYNRGVKAFW